MTFLPWFSRIKNNEDFYTEERCENDVRKYNQIDLVEKCSGRKPNHHHKGL